MLTYTQMYIHQSLSINIHDQISGIIEVLRYTVLTPSPYMAQLVQIISFFD